MDFISNLTKSNETKPTPEKTSNADLLTTAKEKVTGASTDVMNAARGASANVMDTAGKYGKQAEEYVRPSQPAEAVKKSDGEGGGLMEKAGALFNKK